MKKLVILACMGLFGCTTTTYTNNVIGNTTVVENTNFVRTPITIRDPQTPYKK